MRKVVFCTILLLSLPVSATISQVQSQATWDVTTGNTCANTFSNTTQHDLIAVWTTWTLTPGTKNTITASVSDGNLNDVFVSAVGPTLQPTSNTAAQIFYLRSIPGASNLTITVTFSSNPTSSNCVIVEYRGADTLNPLDSATASYSGSQTAFLDSGNLIPDSSSLLIFAGGIADQNFPMVAGSGFTSIQASSGSSWGTGMVENSTASITASNVLQRATACIGVNNGTPSLPCPPGTTTANWLMEVAVFRDPPSAVVTGWNPVRPYQVADATQFPGGDPCAQTKTAIEIPINNNKSPVVDSRGFISNGIPCAAAPMTPSDKGTWLPSPGNWQFDVPLILGGQMDIWGASLGYDRNHGTVFEAASLPPGTWPTLTGGYGGVAPTGSGCPGTISQWSSSCYYSRGTEATTNNGATTWYALQNGFHNISPGVDPNSPYYWTNAANFPNPVVEENITGNGNDVESNSIHNLALSAQYTQAGGPLGSQTMTDGVVLYLNTNGQEQVIADRIKYRNPTVAGIWLDNGLTADSGPYLGGTIGYDLGPTSGSTLNQLACKVNAANNGIGGGGTYSTQQASISNISVTTSSPYFATITLSGTVPLLWVGEIVDIVNYPSTPSFSPYIAPGITEESTTGNTHGYWMVWSVTDATHFTILVPSGYSGVTCSGVGNCGTAAFFPLGINVTANGTPAGTAVTPNRGFYNFTINGTSCTAPPTPPTYTPNYSNYPPLGAQWSTGSMPFHDSHIEGHRVGLCVGCFGPDTQSHFANLNIETNVETAILISNQYTNGTIPGVTQADFKDIQCGSSGGGLDVTNCIVDLINGNTLTRSSQSGYIHHYWLDSDGIAHFEGGNCSGFQNGWCRGTTAGSTDTAWNFYSGGTVQSSIDNLITPPTNGGSPPAVFSLTGGQGGACNGLTGCTASGIGQGSSMMMGNGGAASGTATTSGAGGSVAITGGNGGSASGSVTTVGQGGSLMFTGGNGGGASGSVTTAGPGGELTLTTGTGGTGSGGTTNGGSGGALVLNTGPGGSGSTNGTPGIINIEQNSINVFGVSGAGAVTINTPITSQPLLLQPDTNGVVNVKNTLGMSDTGPTLEVTPDWSVATGTIDAALLVNPGLGGATNSLLIDAKDNGTSEWKVDEQGNVTQAGGLTLSGTTTTISTSATNPQLTLQPNTNGVVNVTNTLTGSETGPTLQVNPTWTGDTSTIDAALLVNPTTGGATNSLLIDAQYGGTSQWKVDEQGNVTQAGGLTLSGTTSVTAPTVNAKRVTVSQASTLVTTNFALSGWGSGATVAITDTTSRDQAFTITITAGTSTTANPVATLSFHDGMWTNVPVYLCKKEGGTVSATQLTEQATTTTLPITLVGTPTSGQTLVISCIGMGT